MNHKLFIDFASPGNNYRRLYGGGNGQPIAKAVGIKTYGLPLNIIDATAGLGQDAFVLASLGCTVTLIERNPQVAKALQDALERGAQTPNIHEIINRMHLVEGDAKTILQNLTPAEYPHVVYLDPMFPKRTKSALVKQELRTLKDVVGADLDADELLAIAKQIATKRIVVKRPKIAPYLANIPPHTSQVGKANRFDIYMPQK